MSERPYTRLLIAGIASAVAALFSASASMAVRLGNGPSGAPRSPRRSDLPRNQPLIVLQFRNGKVISLTGTAVPRSKRKRLGHTAPASPSVQCSVNFTHSRQRNDGRTTVDWFGGIGCTQAMFLFGQAFLHESATKVDGTGKHYQGVMSSAASGRNGTIVNEPHPSLYIRHLTNVYFPVHMTSGRIRVSPAAGRHLNSASWCAAAHQPGYGLGVHCELYTNRF